jgi:hypothetical protein
MRFCRLNILVTLLFLISFNQQKVCAQWAAPYANSWLNYNKPYIKIGIVKKGVHRIPFSALPKELSVSSPEKLQLWRRGRQISIISTTNNEILFYAVPNDGATDSLLYRPMSSRLNPYFSMYGDEGAYFLTVGESAGLRARVVNQPADSKIDLIPHHSELVTTTFQTDYSLSTQVPIRPDFFNSYFELGASRTGKITTVGTLLSNNFSLKSLANSTEKAFIKMLLHGRSNNDRKIEVYVGKNAQSLRLVSSVANSGFSGTEFVFELKPEDTDENKNGILALKTVGTDPLDRFSLAYFSVGFPQAFQMDALTSKEFYIKAASSAASRIQLTGTATNLMLLDISDKDSPAIIQGNRDNLVIPRVTGKSLTLLATNEITTVANEKIKSTVFSQFAPKESNYIIITADNLHDGSVKYAEYRSSQAGGGYKPLVVNISEIYNHFNYGEPSPVAIKRFMSYMLSEGGKEKYLFLIGKSITHNERMKRELPDEVPTIGYPASDLLLVEGIAGTAADIPAAPVGRLSAITNQNILDYLQKVKDYEFNATGEYGWRKKFLHLNGGKNVDEISQLKGLLQALVPSVVDGVVGGKVIPYVKQQAMAEVESVNITADVNEGVGLITYFGHGSPTVTDLDMGYITDASRGYNNVQKYPMMYFNGCGVGNIFSARFNANPTAADRITLSLDWLMSPNRGSVAIIANSFESFVSPSSKYLQQLYKSMFVEPSTVNLPIGKIQIAVASAILAKDKDRYSVANVHQSLLQGDPALRLITVDKPDYSVDPDESLTLYSESGNKTIEESDSLRLSVSISNHGRSVSGQVIPLRYTYFGEKGNIIKSGMMQSFPYEDTVSISFPNNRDIQKLQVYIDPNHIISELNTSNNVAELKVDWNSVKNQSSYSLANIKDIVPPILNVFFDGRQIKEDEVIEANPTLTLLLRDDRQLVADTALIEVFIKRCGDNLCDFERVSYLSASVDVDSLDSQSFQVRLATQDLGSGIYELLVNVKDRAGNTSAQPYRIRFQVKSEGPTNVQVIASPNPTSSYLRFELTAKKDLNLKSIRYLIYNQAGLLVEEEEMMLSGSASTTEWYWTPSASLPSGLYAYKVFLKGSDGNSLEQLTGKIVLVK